MKRRGKALQLSSDVLALLKPHPCGVQCTPALGSDRYGGDLLNNTCFAAGFENVEPRWGGISLGCVDWLKLRFLNCAGT